MLNTTLFFAKWQGHYLDKNIKKQKLSKMKIYNKPTLALALLTPLLELK